MKPKVALSKQPSKTRRAIELSGLHAVFRIHNADFSVHYFSTFASPRKDSPEGESYYDLLLELHPMRERVKASKIKNLNTLLQRDLDDTRIANELIPYLCGRFTSTVGFFPPVLAVLMPDAFISGENGASSYPASSKSSGGNISCEDYWEFESLEPFGRLGILKIYSSTEIIVLDGQHRANAFRFIAGQSPQSKIHQSFYDKIKPPGKLDSELPVTLIWFEKEKTKSVTPTDISRELFVAVNNSAKNVSRSRSILLDERDACAIPVSTYYSYLAEKRGFGSDGMSLLSAAFDIDVDESMTGIPVTAITTPVHLYHATRHFFFAVSRYDDMCGKATNHPQTNKLRFEKVFGVAPYIQISSNKRIADISSIDDKVDLKLKVRDVYIPILESLLNDSRLAQVHHQALDAVKKWTAEHGAVSHQETWELIMCGGEGLYNQITRPNDLSAGGNQVYKKATKEIEEKIRAARISIARNVVKKSDPDDIEEAFRLFTTMAAQIGILMAISTFLCLSTTPGKKPGHVLAIKRITGISLTSWIAYLAGFSDLYFKNLESKSWVRFHRLFVRIFLSDTITVFSNDPTLSPEYEMLKEQTLKTLEGLQDAKSEINEKSVQNAISSAAKVIKAAFEKLKQKPLTAELTDEDLEQLRKRFIESYAVKIESDDDDETSGDEDITPLALDKI